MAIATKIRIAVFGSALLVSLSLVNAQDFKQLEGPRLGFVLDKTLGVLPVYGVPGAATLGRSILSLRGMTAIVMAPQGGYGLAITARDRRLVLLRYEGSFFDSTDLDFEPGAGRIAFSPSGKSAAVYYGGDSSLAIITGLPDSASLSWRHNLPDFAGNLGVFAVSDDGNTVLAVAGNREAPLFVIGPDLNYRILHQISGSPSIAFLVNSQNAVVADGAVGSVLLLKNPKGETQITEVGGRAEGVFNPVGVAVSADNRQVFVANGTPGGVISLSLSGGEASFATCNCTPTLMEPLGGYAAFRLNDAGQGPIWLFDAESSPQRIVFVPGQSRRSPVRRESSTRKQIGVEP